MERNHYLDHIYMKYIYAPTEPGPPLLFDGRGITQPLQLQTLSGDQYMVHGCWGKSPVAHPNFKQLAAEQHPDALGQTNSWDVLLHTTDMPTHTLDLTAVGNMLVRGEFDLEEPVLIIWTDLEQGAHVEINAVGPATEPIVTPASTFDMPASKRPRIVPGS